MLNTLENYLVSVNSMRTKLASLTKEAFIDKGWEGILCVTSWINENETTRATEGYMGVTLWLYVPGAPTQYVKGFSLKSDGGSMEALKNANLNWLKALKELASNRQQTVAKADFYNQIITELSVLNDQIFLADV